MARACVCSVVGGAALATVACGPTAASTNQPGSGAASMPAAAASDEDDEGADTTSSSSGADGFLVMVESRCRDTWNGMLVRSAGHDDASTKRGGFEISNASTQELRLQPGDALVLTSPHGGILDVHFEGVAEGYGARVEVNSECSGVKRTLVPHDVLAAEDL